MDERLMQVLRAANAVLAAAPAAAWQSLAATPFAITPLGPRLGLLQWVGGTVPLFQVRCALWRHSCRACLFPCANPPWLPWARFVCLCHEHSSAS